MFVSQNKNQRKIRCAAEILRRKSCGGKLMESSIQNNIRKIREEISENPFGERVHIVAATKTRTAEEIKEAMAGGIDAVAENRDCKEKAWKTDREKALASRCCCLPNRRKPPTPIPKPPSEARFPTRRKHPNPPCPKETKSPS